MGYGWSLKKSTISFGELDRFVIAGDDATSPNSNASSDAAVFAKGLNTHGVYSTFNQNLATTVASTNVSVTLTGGPAYKITCYNPAATATVYVNLNAAAVLPVATTTPGSFPLLAGSFWTIEFLTTTVQVISTTGSIDIWIGSFPA